MDLQQYPKQTLDSQVTVRVAGKELVRKADSNPSQTSPEAPGGFQQKIGTGSWVEKIRKSIQRRQVGASLIKYSYQVLTSSVEQCESSAEMVHLLIPKLSKERKCASRVCMAKSTRSTMARTVPSWLSTQTLAATP